MPMMLDADEPMSMLEYLSSPFAETDAEAVVVPVDLVGAYLRPPLMDMEKRFGGGIIKEYRHRLHNGMLKLGRGSMHMVSTSYASKTKYIIFLPLALRLDEMSVVYKPLIEGLEDVGRILEATGSFDVAIPALGCNRLDRLRWETVETIIHNQFHRLDVWVEVYPPQTDEEEEAVVAQPLIVTAAEVAGTVETVH